MRCHPAEVRRGWMASVSCLQVMAQPHSVAKGEEWVRAADASFVVDDIGEWVQQQSNSEVCRGLQLDAHLCTDAVPCPFTQHL